MERVRLTRLRWRLRGAWQAPVFAVATLAEGVLLNELPVWGDGPGGFVPGLLIAGFLNLILVAGVAPLAGRALRLRRRDLPRPIASDYAGAALMVALLSALLVSGLVHHADVAAEHRARAAQFVAVSHYVEAQVPELRDRLGEADTVRVDEDFYRTCLPEPDPDRWLCLFVDTGQEPPGITRDTNRTSNADFQRRGFQ